MKTVVAKRYYNKGYKGQQAGTVFFGQRTTVFFRTLFGSLNTWNNRIHSDVRGECISS